MVVNEIVIWYNVRKALYQRRFAVRPKGGQLPWQIMCKPRREHVGTTWYNVRKALCQRWFAVRVGRKTVALISGDAFRIGGGDTGHYKSFVDINATADFVHDF